MRKPVFPRILLITLLYCAIFAVLVSIQFAKRGGFTQRAGSLMVSGQRRLPGDNDPPTASNEYLLDGDVHVFFGGIDFGMIAGKEEHCFFLVDEEGIRENILPERMILSGDSIQFLFPGESMLEYSTQYTGGSREMRITGSFPEGIVGAELPIKLLRKTALRDAGDGQIIISADGTNYAFGRGQIDEVHRMLFIAGDGGAISYRAIPEQNSLSPNEFILPQAETASAYNEALTRWRDQNFSLWNRIISEQNNEDTVIAYAGEALVRGTYKAAIAAVSPAFLRGTARTYESSVYLGGLGEAYRSMVSKEREKIARISRQINEKSLEFLKEPRIIEFFAVRGQGNFIDASADLVRSIDPAVLALDITPGILEGYTDWKAYRPNTENPFERLVDQACFVITGSLKYAAFAWNNEADSSALQAARGVFSLSEGQGEVEFNLRLGKALLQYAETEQNEIMAGIGRSLILSALSLSGASGVVKAGLILSNAGEVTENQTKADLPSARLYRILEPVDTYPKALTVDASTNGIWAWTAAQAVSTVQKNDTLDITVRFPAGETHYMLIRGIRPFARIQLYGMDFRSDPQFERYDSSGWVYYSQEQILVLKMKHRTSEELIRIVYREEPAPAPAAPQPAAQPPAASQPAAQPPVSGQTQPAVPAPFSPAPADNNAVTPPASSLPQSPVRDYYYGQ